MGRPRRRRRPSADLAAEVVCVPGWAPRTGVCGACGKPLTGRKEWFCNDRCRSVYAPNHLWTDARRAARRRDGSCVMCGSSEELEVNHIIPREGRGYGAGCHHHLANLEVLCHQCHLGVTNLQVRSRKERAGRTVAGHGVNFYVAGVTAGNPPRWFAGASSDAAYSFPDVFDACEYARLALIDARSRGGPEQWAVVTEMFAAAAGPEWRPTVGAYEPLVVRVTWSVGAS